MSPNGSKGLGRGLSALMSDIGVEGAPEPDAPVDRAPRPDARLPIEMIVPNPDQPRRHFSEEALTELAESIRSKGIIQPLIVRPDPVVEQRYQIVAGERRWRAAQQANLHDVPVLIREFSDAEILEVALIENIQRADLNPIEEAEGYARLLERFEQTQDRLADAMGKSRSHIANLLRLLRLPADVQDHVRTGALSAGHARALITSDDASDLARRIIVDGLSVRDAERFARTAESGRRKSSGKADGSSTGGRPAKSPDTVALERDLSGATGLGVDIQHDDNSGDGRVILKYRDLQMLDALIQRLSGMS